MISFVSHLLLTYMTACILYGTVPIHIAQLAQTAAIRVVRWIREAINNNWIIVAMEDLTHTTIELIVCNWCPKRWLRITNLCHISHLCIEHLCAIIGIIWITILGWTIGRRWCTGQTVIWWIRIGVNRTGTAHRCVAIAKAVRIEATVRVANIVWHTWLRHLIELQHRMSRRIFWMTWHQHWWQDWTLDTLIMIRINADFLLFGAKRILA